MHKRDGIIRYSATDLVGFLECPHRTTLDLINLDTPLEKAEPDEQMALIQDKGFAHEAGFLDSLRSEYNGIVELSSSGSFASNLADTIAAMKDGADIIFQAALAKGDFIGYADFLRRVDRPSHFGDWSYEVADTKLAHRSKPKFMIQLAHYSELLSDVQNVMPESMQLVLGNYSEQRFRVGDYLHYYRRLRTRFDDFLVHRPITAPEKCDYCGMCDWRERCADEWESGDHLNRVANISKVQIRRLEKMGIRTLGALGSLTPGSNLPGIRPETLEKLRAQAVLQKKKQETGENQLELLPKDPDSSKGFNRLPPADPGDLFFDMEGDPLHEGGLEYLFGVYTLRNGDPEFIDYWAHDRREEKRAFSAFIDFVTDHLKRHPGAHIYHYAHYEPTAMKRLMSLHGVKEAEVDQLLRDGRFVDLYQVVREAIRVSEPKYSIKNLETFYMEKRAGDVTNAGASIVYYEKWRESRAEDLLQKIRDYNEDDCRSTYLLREWLLSLKPRANVMRSSVIAQETVVKSPRIMAHEAKLSEYETKLLDGLIHEEAESMGGEYRLKALLHRLLDFHRRAHKPVWWALFARRDMSLEELIDESECIADLVLQAGSEVASSNGIVMATYQYPEQEFKLHQGDECCDATTSDKIGTLEKIDEEQRTVEIKFRRNFEIPKRISVCAGGPINTDAINKALFRLADGYLNDPEKFTAALDFLRKAPPRIKNHQPGMPIIDETKEVLPQIIEAVSNLDRSTLFIQGPPGAGKTFTGSNVIVELLARGKRVGISSNSHKAIHNLLQAVEKQADERGFDFRGAYKSSSQSRGSEYEGNRIVSYDKSELAIDSLLIGESLLIAGTAWLFSDPELAVTLDYLFVDEAGQVASANLVAMATSAQNIVLLGDQMQLGQPIQGDHPGESGLSSLEFLLEGRATIPPDRGVFLNTSWRMHPDVCDFISEAIYEGRLKSEEKNSEQRLILQPGAHPALRPTGLSFVPAIHDTCSQRSDEEAEIVLSLYESLLEQKFRDRNGREHQMGIENILVVAPYNMQVNLLRRTLPEGARVGTVDKFQGQEAEAVIVSMATSNSDTMPRYIEFLYSKNRLNVAISRARCLALLVASPDLADITCSTVEQMGLVNLMSKIVQMENK